MVRNGELVEVSGRARTQLYSKTMINVCERSGLTVFADRVGNQVTAVAFNRVSGRIVIDQANRDGAGQALVIDVGLDPGVVVENLE